jgi:aldose 1-epimerase
MRIEEGPFGVTPLGCSITRFTITNDHGIQVSFIDLGAAVQSLLVADRSGKVDDVVLGYDTIEGYWHDVHYMGGTIGRYANRIAGGRFTLDGVTHLLSRGHHGHHLHGGTLGFDKRMWHATFEEDRDCTMLRFKRISRNGEEGYPGNLSVTVNYFLNNDNELGIQYRAETDQPTPVNLTHHGYFNLSGNHNSTIDDHSLWINSDYFLPVNSESIPIG